MEALSQWLDQPRPTFPKNLLPSVALQGSDLLLFCPTSPRLLEPP